MLELGQPWVFSPDGNLKIKKCAPDPNSHSVSPPHLQPDIYTLHWWLNDGEPRKIRTSEETLPGQDEAAPSLRWQVVEFDDGSEESCCASDGHTPTRLAQISECNRFARICVSSLGKLLTPPPKKRHERVIDWHCVILKVMYEEIYSNIYLLEQQ